jgi:flagellar hook-associated protein 1 FlgK
MGSLTSAFNLATASLSLDQSALNVVSNNVANQNTAGYTREVATINSGVTVQFSGQVTSYGTPSLSVASQRNRVLEQRVQQQTQAQSSSESRSGVLSQIENIFGISTSSATAGSTQLGTATDSFFSSLTALSANPADSATRQTVVTAATSLASAFNSAATQVSQIQSGVNASFTSSVAAVNGLTSTIADLNTKIQQISPNGDAGALEDQRQQAIAQLSQYIGLDQITTENNGISLTTTGGTTLVIGSNSYALSTSISNGATILRDSSGNDITAGTTGGSIGGLVTAQTTDIPTVSNALDALAYRIGTAVNTQNQAGLTTTGAAGGAIFSLPTTQKNAALTISVIPTTGDTVAAAGTGEGSTGNTNGLALAQIQQQVDGSGNTVDQNLAALLSTIGNSASSTSNASTAQQATLTQLTSQRDSLSAVSLDEEAASLTQYQNSYNAAAKLFSIVNTLYASALNLGVETTVT